MLRGLEIESATLLLLEHNANNCIALVDECQLEKTKRFLRLLSVDLMIEADKLRRGDGGESLLLIQSALGESPVGAVNPDGSNKRYKSTLK